MRGTREIICQTLLSGAAGTGPALSSVTKDMPVSISFERDDEHERLLVMARTMLEKALAFLNTNKGKLDKAEDIEVAGNVLRRMIELQRDLKEKLYFFNGEIYSTGNYVLAFNHMGKIGVDPSFLASLASHQGVGEQLFIRLLLFSYEAHDKKDKDKGEYDPRTIYMDSERVLMKLYEGETVREIDGIMEHYVIDQLKSLGPDAQADADGGGAILASGLSLSQRHRRVIADVLSECLIGRAGVRLMEEKEAVVVDSQGLFAKEGVKLYIVPGLNQKIRAKARGIGVKFDDMLIAHPGVYHGAEQQVFVDKSLFGIFEKMDNAARNEIVSHQLWYARGIARGDRLIERHSPLRHALSEFQRVVQEKAGIPPEIRGMSLRLTPDEIACIKKMIKTGEMDLRTLRTVLSILKTEGISLDGLKEMEEAIRPVTVDPVVIANLAAQKARSRSMTAREIYELFLDFREIVHDKDRAIPEDKETERAMVEEFRETSGVFIKLGLESYVEETDGVGSLGIDGSFGAYREYFSEMFGVYGKLKGMGPDFAQYFYGIMRVIALGKIDLDGLKRLSVQLNGCEYISPTLVETYFSSGDASFLEAYGRELVAYMRDRGKYDPQLIAGYLSTTPSADKVAAPGGNGAYVAGLKAYDELLVLKAASYLDKLVERSKGERVLFAFDNELGKVGGAPAYYLYKAVEMLSEKKGPDGRKKYENIEFVKGSGDSRKFIDAIKGKIAGGVKKENVFVVVKDTSLADADYGFIKGTGWITGINERANDIGVFSSYRMPVMESVIMMIMAASGAGKEEILKFSNEFSMATTEGHAISEERMSRMLEARIFYVIPKCLQVNYRDLQDEYQLIETFANQA
ncbi:MAG: hypothetical protein HQL30_06310 [Candidatus Omnitrophica bacterium]|nr:hypothetical protein [Candidatus Omnitrophota bacterium]